MCKASLAICIILLCSGCTNNFSKFYYGKQKNELISAQYSQCDTPVLYPMPHVGRAELDTTLEAEGYKIIGVSDFEGPEEDAAKLALEHGKSLGACRVFLESKFLGATQALIPIVTPTTSRSYHSGTVYGPGLGAMATYHGQATTYGTTTSMMPTTFRQFRYTAIYAIRKN